MRTNKNQIIYSALIATSVFIILTAICSRFNIITIPDKDELVGMQFNLLTVNTVFAGFSFTVLGLIISLSDTSVLQNLKETSFLRTYCAIAVKSISFFILSIAISLYFILGINYWIESHTKKDMIKCTNNLPYIVELLFLLYGIILFCKSVCKLAKIMNKSFEMNEKKGIEKVDKFNKAMKL